MSASPNLRLFRRVLRHGGLFGGVLLFTALYALVSGVSLGMILPFVDLLFSGGIVDLGPAPEEGVIETLRYEAQARAADWFFSESPREGLLRICFLLLAAFAVKGVIGFVLSIASVTLEEKVLKDLRDDLFEHLQSLSMTWFSKRRAGDLLSRATNDISVVRKAVSSLFRTLPRDSLLVAVYLTIVFVASWKLALLCFLVFPVLALIIGAIGKSIRRRSSRAQEKMADLATMFEETIRGIRVVKAFGGKDFTTKRFLSEAESYLGRVVRLRRIASLASPTAEMMGAVGAVIVLWAGGNEVLSGTGLSAAWFVIFLAAMVSLMQPVRALTQLHADLEEGGAAARRVFEILDAVPEIRDAPGARTIEDVGSEIRFDGVSFEYDAEVPVIHDVSLTVRRGEVVALVGPSGAGKSTLVDMIPRFYDPDAGSIRIDGVDLRELRVTDLRRLVGVVTQETILFHDTIRANIAYADPDPDQSRVEDAARAANAHDFITRTTMGYDTVIGDRGLRLSGGERQRLSIARAIYRNPPLLIFDEATSSLDSESEKQVQEAIDHLMRGRTAIVIAHRLSTVRNAHRIVVLDRGRIVEEGTHDELLRLAGLYARLSRIQFVDDLSPDPSPA